MLLASTLNDIHDQPVLRLITCSARAEGGDEDGSNEAGTGDGRGRRGRGRDGAGGAGRGAVHAS